MSRDDISFGHHVDNKLRVGVYPCYILNSNPIGVIYIVITNVLFVRSF